MGCLSPPPPPPLAWDVDTKQLGMGRVNRCSRWQQVKIYRRISQCKALMYNGRISNFLPLLILRNRVDVTQNLQGLNYEVCSTNIATIFRTQIDHSSFCNMLRYTPAASCYATRVYEIRLYFNSYFYRKHIWEFLM